MQWPPQQTHRSSKDWVSTLENWSDWLEILMSILELLG
jgi:hypothetical protein